MIQSQTRRAGLIYKQCRTHNDKDIFYLTRYIKSHKVVFQKSAYTYGACQARAVSRSTVEHGSLTTLRYLIPYTNVIEGTYGSRMLYICL